MSAPFTLTASPDVITAIAEQPGPTSTVTAHWLPGETPENLSWQISGTSPLFMQMVPSFSSTSSVLSMPGAQPDTPLGTFPLMVRATVIATPSIFVEVPITLRIIQVRNPLNVHRMKSIVVNHQVEEAFEKIGPEPELAAVAGAKAPEAGKADRPHPKPKTKPKEN